MKKNLPVRLSPVICTLLIVFLFYSTARPQNIDDSPATAPVMQEIEDLESDLDSIMSEISTPGAAVADGSVEV